MGRPQSSFHGETQASAPLVNPVPFQTADLPEIPNPIITTAIIPGITIAAINGQRLVGVDRAVLERSEA